MKLNVFDSFPDNKHLKYYIVFFIFLFIIMNIFVNDAFDKSNYPVSFIESQLSFNGTAIKEHFSTMSEVEIGLYAYAQFVDYVYLVSYGLLIFFVGIFIGRKFPKDSFLRNSSYFVSIAGIVAAFCDAIENGFILLMISDYKNFPDMYAILHSCFALIKFILLGLSIVIIIVFSLFYIIREIRKNFK